MVTNSVRINIAILGGFSLVLGGAIYLFIRDPQELYVANYLLLPEQSATSLLKYFPISISWLTNSLPTAVHAFSFSLFTALIFRLNKFTIAISCIAWAVIDWIFELLQILKPTSCILLSAEKNIGGLFCGYISNGVFDWNDMLSILIGSILAYIFLLYFAKRSVDQ